MTQEEKLEEAKRLYETANADQKYVLESLFPELAESENERIINAIKQMYSFIPKKPEYIGTVAWKDIFAWLEKQGEQNLEWSKEENDKISNIIAWIKDYPRLAKFKEEAFVKANNYAEWLKSIRNKYIPQKQGMCKLSHDDEIMIKQLTEYFTTGHGLQNTKEAIVEWLGDIKEKLGKQGEQNPAWSEKYIADVFEKVGLAKIVREQSNDNLTNALQDAMIELSKFVPQPKQEWSEEDERILNQIIKDYEKANESWLKGQGSLPFGNRIKWLKSLRPQNRWKPSESYILLLEKIANGKSNPQDFQASLGGLIGQLKKLREE